VYYTTETKGITALGRKDGQPRWHHAIEHGAGPCVPVASKGLVVVGGSDGFVYALDAKDGEVKWQANIVADAPPDAPGFPGERARIGRSLARPVGVACDGETVYQNLFDQSRVVAIDLATGKLRWSYQTGGWMGGAPAFSSDHVLVGSQDKFVHCLDRRTGRLVWKFETKHRNSSTPVVEGRFVYFGSDNGGVFRVNLADGKQIWKFDTDPDDTGRRFISSAPLLVKDTLYIATCEGQVYALDKETWELRWKLRASENSQITSSIVTDGRRFFVATREDWEKRGEPSLVAIAVK
jgi:outer membrane protein assembly factor BamB